MDFKYIKRLFAEPETSYFLFGPRGTGKSTVTARNNPDALFIDLRLADMRYILQANPDYLIELVRTQGTDSTIIIDEIQKIPELLPIVHKLIEEKKGWRFILTGSSARKLKRQGTDLLGGRALKKTLHPFIAYELKDKFDLDDVLEHGLLPLRYGSTDPGATLQAYISLYIEEEVKAEGLIRRYEPFTRFLQTMSFSHGAQINIANISRECQVKRTTVAQWITILYDLLICFELHPFTLRAKRELVVHPKFYFFDVGVYRTVRPVSIGDSKTEVDGAGLEGLIAQHLVAWRDYTTQKHELNFWRTRNDKEVDFVLYGPLGFWAIEVKNTTTIRSQDLDGLQTFAHDYPEAKLIMLYRGTHKLLKGNILCLPCQEFLKRVCPNQPLDVAF